MKKNVGSRFGRVKDKEEVKEFEKKVYTPSPSIPDKPTAPPPPPPPPPPAPPLPPPTPPPPPPPPPRRRGTLSDGGTLS